MASAAANHVRSSMGPQGQPMHLGSFSRLDIADFDSRGRYPTTPSPQETRTIPATYSFANTMGYTLDDRPGDPDINQNISGPSGTRDGVANYDNVRASAQDMSDRQEQTTLADVENAGNPTLAGPGTPTIQDIARTSLPPGPRHPQAPSRNSTVPQNVNLPQQPQNTTQQPIRTGSMAPAPYPYNASPATTPTQVPTSQPNGAPQTQQGSFIPTNLNYGPTMLQVQTSPRPQQPPPPEEVCIECMMRDRDMADVTVVGPGIWDRESDVHLRELLEREDEEERAWRDRHAAELAMPANKLRPPRRASKGHRLTEQNLKIWLQLNPKEAHARIMTIDTYVRQQGQLLMEEAEARAKAQQEAQRVDARVKDTYSQLRQSAYDIGTVGLANDDFASGVRIQPPRSSMYGEIPSARKEDYKHRRDMTLLENGMIMERVDIKREEKERKKEEKKARKMSQITDTSSISPAAYMTPPPTGMDMESNGGYEVPYANMSSPSLQTSRPKSAPLDAPMTKYSSHASVDGKGARFLGSKHWQAPWNSGASVAPSGSMMDMHLALGQEREGELQQFGVPMDPINQRYATSSFSLPASPRNRSRPHTADAMMHPRRSTSPDPVMKKKASGFGKLWKMVRSKKSESRHQEQSIISSLPPEDDMSMPLPPPPKMPYLNHHPQPSPHSRQVSNPGAQMGGMSQVSHPRSISQPGPNSAGAISPTTAPSSILPSPTSNRFPWRESGDDRRQSTARDLNGDASMDAAQGMNSPDPNMVQQQAYGEPNGMRMLVTGGSASSEYSRMLNPSNTMPLSATRSPAPSTMVSSSAHSPRPLSSVHKPLPPPPPGESNNMRQMPPSHATNGTYGGRPATMVMPEETYAPHAPFRDEGYEGRRQSFSGPISRDMLPPGAGQGLQSKRSIPAMAYMDQTSPYQEFGNPYDQAYGQTSPYLTTGALSDGGKSKRRSRFLPFLGKKDKDKTPAPNFAPQMQQQYVNGEMRYSTMHVSPSSPMMAPARPPFGHSQRSRSSASLSTPDFAPGMNGNSHLSQPAFGFTEGGRPMSGISTYTTATRVNKPLIDELVPRDPDFLAYRYPSTDQTLDVSRR